MFEGKKCDKCCENYGHKINWDRIKPRMIPQIPMIIKSI